MPRRGQGSAPSLCDPPAADLSRWTEVSIGAVRLAVPPRFNLFSSAVDARLYRAGSRTIGVARGTSPTLFSGDETATVESRCTTVIGGRPVEIAALRVTLADASMAPTGNAGTKFVALAQWIGASDGRDVSVWLYTPYRGDIMALRQLFWTVRLDAAPSPGAPEGA